MNYKKITFINTFLILLVFITSCKESSPIDSGEDVVGNGSIAFTINGGDFTNRTVNLTLPLLDSAERGALYIRGRNTTVINLNDLDSLNSDSIYFSQIFLGKSVGTYSWSSDEKSVLMAFRTSPDNSIELISDSGATEITEYGSKLRKAVKGNFSGKLTAKKTLVQGDTTLIISQRSIYVQGSFVAKRLDDLK